jgi:hypothetical protein
VLDGPGRFDASKINLAVPGARITTTYFDCSDNTPQVLQWFCM